jgi:hypothetical protein
MRLEELTVEVRDGNLNRLGLLMPTDLVGAKFIARYNNVGTWEVKLNPASLMVEALRTPGAGIIVTGPSGVLFSGPMRSARLEQSIDNSEGTWFIEGTDDTVILTERLAYPDPTQDDVNAQTQAYDVRTGAAETVIKSYVQDNISAVAGTDRAIPNLEIEYDLGRGTDVTAQARFDVLQELLYPLAQTGGLGYEIAQDGSALEFQVYVPTDRSASVRMDIDNNQLTRTEYAYVGPKGTRAIVGGAGEAEDRIFYEGTSTESLAAESTWGRRIETFLDDRGTKVQADLDQAAQEFLVDNGKTIVTLAVTPSDETNMRYGIDWNLGDKVTVVIGDQEAVSVVTEVGIGIGTDGVRIGATLGTPNATDFESRIIQKAITTEARVSNLEKSVTGYGINVQYQPAGGTVSGTQPTFSGPAIFGSYNRFGNMVHFSIRVDFTNITNFGTGQYYLTLPYPARVAYQFRDGCLHDVSANRSYHVSAHVYPGETLLYLFTTDSQGNRIYDFPFSQGEPVTLTTADNFHISGTYEIEG